jgi:dihydroorotate dehydrogenase
MLTLRKVNYGNIFCAVGARGFAGEGYPYHALWRFAGMTWENTAFAGKTMTLHTREGNMPLKDDGMTPVEWFPKCIWGDLRNGGEMVNQVGLSNFGIKDYLRREVFNNLKKPFMISIMLMEQTAEGRKEELFEILHLLRHRMPSWVIWALQINFACPNTGHDNSAFYDEMASLVILAKEILVNVPIVANVNALMPTKLLVGIAEHADALWIGNAIPFGDPASTVNWKRFGVNKDGKPISPLAERNPAWVGGLSSPDCLYDTIEKVKDVRRAGVTIPIVAGNGIRTKECVLNLKRAGAQAVFVGSLGTVRPWRMRSIIKYSNQLFSTT